MAAAPLGASTAVPAANPFASAAIPLNLLPARRALGRAGFSYPVLGSALPAGLKPRHTRCRLGRSGGAGAPRAGTAGGRDGAPMSQLSWATGNTSVWQWG